MDIGEDDDRISIRRDVAYNEAEDTEENLDADALNSPRSSPQKCGQYR